MLLKFLLTVFILAVTLLTTSTTAYAQTSTLSAATTQTTATPTATATAEPTAPPITPPESAINLTLSPISIQLDVNPGQSETSQIKIRNNGTEDEPLKVSFGTFGFNERTQQIDLNQELPGESLGWISVDLPEIVVKPGEWETVNVTFAPPADSALTYYYAVIFSRIDQVVPEGATTRVTGAPAVLVLTNVVSPLSKRELQLESFSVPKVWVEFLPQSFLLKIRNSGNIHLSPIGNIFIDGMGKKDIAVLPANPKNTVILPGSMRELTSTWEDGFPRWQTKMTDGQPVRDEAGVVRQELKWDFSQADRFRIGKYTAHLLLVYDNGERDIPIESYVSFWVIPWRISLAIVAITIFFLAGLRSFILSIVRSVRRKKA